MASFYGTRHAAPAESYKDVRYERYWIHLGRLSFARASAFLSGAKAAQSSGFGGSSSTQGAGASENSTSTSTNTDGSTTTTVVNGQGQIVSTSTTAPTNQAVVATNFATQANADILQSRMPASLLNMVV